LLLGDSFVESLRVPIPASFPYLLERCLDDYYPQPVEVINAGMANYSNAEALFFLEQEGLRYKPDLVLAVFSIGNDFDAYAARERSDGWLNAFGGYLISLDDKGHLQRTWVDWQQPSPFEQMSATERFLRRFKTYQILTHPDTQLHHWLEDFRDKAPNTFLFGSLLTALPQSEPSTPETTDDFRQNFSLMIYTADFPYSEDTPPKLKEGWAIIDRVFSDMQAVTAEAPNSCTASARSFE
jgi:hypothetical protein